MFKYILIFSLGLVGSSSFASIKVQTVTTEVSVDFSSDQEQDSLLQLIQVINEVNNGSAAGNVTDQAKISCTKSLTDEFCTITSLLDGSEETLDLSGNQEFLLKLIQAINTVNAGSAAGHVTDAAKISCSLTKTDHFCTIEVL
jgi:hypothetical protein